MCFSDNDPRLQEILTLRQHQSGVARPEEGPQVTPPGTHQPLTGGFNLNAPLLRIMPSLPGQQAMMGLPDVEVFGMRMTPLVWLGLPVLLLAFGWRGLIAGGIIFYIWQASSSPTPSGRSSGQTNRPISAGGGASSSGIGGMLSQLQTSFQQQFSASNSQPHAQSDIPIHVSASRQGLKGRSSNFMGKGHKLGGND